MNPLKKESGQSLAECAMVIALIAIVAIAILGRQSRTLQIAFHTVNCTVAGAVYSGPFPGRGWWQTAGSGMTPTGIWIYSNSLGVCHYWPN